MGFEEKDDDEEFEEKMERLTAELSEHFRKSEELEKKLKRIWQGLGMNSD